jgi:hypothetical protein
MQVKFVVMREPFWVQRHDSRRVGLRIDGDVIALEQRTKASAIPLDCGLRPVVSGR